MFRELFTYNPLVWIAIRIGGYFANILATRHGTSGQIALPPAIPISPG